MTSSTLLRWAGCALTTFALGCTTPAPAPAPEAEPAAEAEQPAAGSDRQAEMGRFPDREFLRKQIDNFEWRATEGNTLGVETVVLEGDPSKPGYYLTINHFPPGVMSRPHFHPDERYCLVLRGTWYTGEGKDWVTDKGKLVGLKPGEYMRHPAGGEHYDGALDEDVWVAIGGYGPTSATVIDKGELFGTVPGMGKGTN